MIIETIDCDYTMPRYACAYLLIHEGRAAFVENNTVHAVPRMLEALARHGLSPEAVDWCIITHVHLDHAGGSSALMRACPNATLVAHPRAAPHVIDPSKLVSSARAVYGEARFAELYGDIQPLDPNRVKVMEDGESLELGGRPLHFLHTRGHANHHFVVHDPEAQAVFTGDAFGIAYPDLQTGGLFVFPSTSPTDFDGPLAREAVERIVATGARTAYLTHFGPITELERGAAQLKQTLEHSEALMEEAYASDAPDEALEARIAGPLRAHFMSRMEAEGAPRSPENLERIRLDLELNAQGLAFAANKKRRKDRKAQA